MRVALYGESAFAYYLVAGDAPSAVAPPSVLDKSCYPTQATLDYVRERMPYLTRPVHCLVPKWERCSLDDVHLDRDPFCASIMALLFRVPNYAFFSWPRASIFSR